MYTVWSRNELIGESALDHVRVFPNLRTGDLRLTEKGLILLDRLAQTHADAYYTVRRLNKGAGDDSDMKTFHADLAAEHDQYETLALELRASDGSVIPTEEIYVRDTEYLLALAQQDDDEEDELLDDVALEDALESDDLKEFEQELIELRDDFPPWVADEPEREPVRFQLYVRLTDEWSIP